MLFDLKQDDLKTKFTLTIDLSREYDFSIFELRVIIRLV